MTRDQLMGELREKGSIDADDVLRLRREVFEDGVVDRAEVEAIFELDRRCEKKDRAWEELFVDELTYYFIHQAEPRGYISDENARVLTDLVVSDGRIARRTELELVVNIVDQAARCPEDLAVFALQAVKESVLEPETAAYGKDRRPAIIDGVDVELVRAVIEGGGGPGAYTVTRPEADLLFDLNDATDESENHWEWQGVFVKGVGSHLMFPLPPPEVPTAKKAVSHGDWLEHRRTHGAFLKELGRAMLDVGGSIEEADPFGRRRSREAAELRESMKREAAAREKIDKAETRWLIDRIGDEISDNERALLEFVRKNAREIPPTLEPLFAKAGL